VRILTVSVENYRILKHASLTFDPSRTVVGGHQEAGKSTLVEAIHHALFLRSRGTSAVHKAMQSDLHDGHPTVTLRFEAGGRLYTIKKVFAGSAAAATTTLADEGPAAGGGAGSRLFRGEEAEARIHELLRADDAGGGNGVANRIKMQWSHLWVWQGTSGHDPLGQANADKPAEQLRDRLGRLGGGGVLESPLDATTARRIEVRRAELFRENGGIRVGSDLARAGDEHTQAEAAFTSATALVAGLEAAVDAIDAADRVIVTAERSLAAATAELKDVADKSRRVGDLRVRLAEEQAAAREAEAAREAIAKADAEIVACERELALLGRSIAPAIARLDELTAGEQPASAALVEALDAMDKAGGRQQEAAAAVARLEFREQLARLTVERHGLGGRCRRIKTLRDKVAALEDERKQLASVTTDDLATLDRLERAREAAAATLEAIATRVEFAAGPGPVRLAGEPLAPTTGVTITSESELTVGPPGAETVLRISPGGGRSLAEAGHALERARREVAATLDRMGVASLAEARRSHARLQALEADLVATRGAVEGLGGEQADRDLAALDTKIAGVAAEIRRRDVAAADPVEQAPSPFATVGDDSEAALRQAEIAKTAVHALLVAAHSARDAAAADAARASAAATVARRRLDELAAGRREVADSIQAARGSIDSLKARRDVLVERFGSDRAAALRDHADAAAATAVAATATQEAIRALSPEALAREQTRLERAIANLQSQRQEAETRRQVARENLRREGTDDPREDVARATVRRRLAAAKLANAHREAEAVRLLGRLFADKKREVEAQFAAPLTSRVADYLRPLFGPDTVVDVGYNGGRFDRLAVARGEFGNVTWDFSQLSGGTKEQVAAAFRLAMAEILAAGHDGTLPVVFDDAFTNADHDRLRKLQRLLDLAAERGLQVIVFSCTPDDYAGLGAMQVTMPVKA